MRPADMLLAALLFVAGPAVAQAADAMICPPGAEAPPRGLEAWSERIDVAAAAREAQFAPPPLPSGQAVNVALHPIERVGFRVQPGKLGAQGSYGGLLRVEIAQAGAYRVALGEGAWIDLLAGAAPLASTGHSHGPPCSGVRKMVDFTLARGTYLIQISASPSPRIAVLIARAPAAP